jgi:hypothetical protein
MKIFIYIYLSLVIMQGLMACGQMNEGQRIIDNAIEVHGGDLYERMKVDFDFRGRHYSAKRDHGRFIYTREFKDSIGYVKDILTNTHFVRLVDGDTIRLSEEKANAYKNSVNSVIYFALLPQALNDPPVIKEWIGESTIEGRKYEKVRVTFKKKGGGKDHEDIFVYWIDKENYRMDYFAYLFYSDGGGIRFRKAKNARKLNGIIFADYMNYALNDTLFDVTLTDSLYTHDQLDLLSEIHLENVHVTLLDNEK